MQQLATGLLTIGDNATNFTRYSELASVQQKRAGSGESIQRPSCRTSKKKSTAFQRRNVPNPLVETRARWMMPH